VIGSIHTRCDLARRLWRAAARVLRSSYRLAAGYALVASRQNRPQPTRKSWPGARLTALLILCDGLHSPTKVPFVLPKSSSHHPPSSQYSRACRRDMSGSSGRLTVQVASRPNVTAGGDLCAMHLSTRPSFGPRICVRVNAGTMAHCALPAGMNAILSAGSVTRTVPGVICPAKIDVLGSVRLRLVYSHHFLRGSSPAWPSSWPCWGLTCAAMRCGMCWSPGCGASVRPRGCCPGAEGPAGRVGAKPCLPTHAAGVDRDAGHALAAGGRIVPGGHSGATAALALCALAGADSQRSCPSHASLMPPHTQRAERLPAGLDAHPSSTRQATPVSVLPRARRKKCFAYLHVDLPPTSSAVTASGMQFSRGFCFPDSVVHSYPLGNPQVAV